MTSDRDEVPVQTPLKTFGNLLREERIHAGYTVDEVASRLKITSRMVRAIEDGDMASMPHAVYARGFIRAYAKLFDIHEDDVNLVCAYLAQGEDDSPQEQFRISAQRSGNGRSGVWILLLLCILIGAGGYWGYANKYHEELIYWIKNWTEEKDTHSASVAPDKKAEDPSSGSTREDTLKNPVPAISRQDGDASALGKPGDGEAVSTAVFGAGEPVTPENPSPASVEINPDPVSSIASVAGMESLTLQTESGTDAQIAAMSPGKRHQIILTALAECWVHSTADGMDTRQLSIQKGETFALSFDRKLVVKLGNAGGIRIKYDGRELPSPGKPGQVKTLIFPQAANTSGRRD